MKINDKKRFPPTQNSIVWRSRASYFNELSKTLVFGKLHYSCREFARNENIKCFSVTNLQTWAEWTYVFGFVHSSLGRTTKHAPDHISTASKSLALVISYSVLHPCFRSERELRRGYDVMLPKKGISSLFRKWKWNTVRPQSWWT